MHKVVFGSKLNLKNIFLGFIFYGFLTLIENHSTNVSFANEIENKYDFLSKKNKLDINYLNQIPNYNYILGEGDQIQIIISKGFPEFTKNYIIDTEGTITMPKIGRIYVKGLTKNELRLLLNKRFENIFKILSVDIKITKYRPIRVYINGEVNDPGMYIIASKTKEFDGEKNIINFDSQEDIRRRDFEPMTSPSSQRVTYGYPTLFDVIREAGGITYYSDLRNVSITRKNTISEGGGKIKANVNFLEIIENYNYQNNIRIFDGDVISIKKSNDPLIGQISKAIKSNLNPSYIKVSLTGRVENPGIITVSKSSTLNDAILAAGDSKVLKGKVIFIRFNADGDIDKRKFNLRKQSKRGAYNNPYLANGDVIHVGKSIFNVTNEVTSEILAPYLKIFPIINLFDD